jgi:uncharacterized SAM-dependent methyltransferase
MQPPGHPISVTEFERDVRAGLSKPGQKELYSKYFYDDLGTALFEAITLLPEYGLTRADLRLLREHAGELPHRDRETKLAKYFLISPPNAELPIVLSICRPPR